MLKKIVFIAVATMILSACNQVQQQSDVTDNRLIKELVAEPLAYDGKEVKFEGIITHICKHSGDKMRVNQVDDADFSIMVMLEEFTPQFSADFEGKHVKLTGVLKTVVRNMETIEHNHDHDHAHDGDHGHECTSTEQAVAIMQERGITPDIRAYVELKSFEITEVAEIQEEEPEETVEVALATDGC